MSIDMKSTTSARQFGQLRARIEAAFSEPAIIVVTSAGRGDGKSAAAFGLAEALANAEHRVLFVDANVEAPVLPRVHRVVSGGVRPDLSKVSQYAKPVLEQHFDGLSLADERIECGMSMDKVKAAAFDMRAHYDYVVVDTSQLLKSDLAVLFATVADGTLLALRLGRLPLPADASTIKTLGRVGANMLGVLTVTPSAIKSFAARREELFQSIRVPARHVTSRHSLAPEVAREMVEPTR